MAQDGMVGKRTRQTEFQARATRNVADMFKSASRAIVEWMCGTGKTKLASDIYQELRAIHTLNVEPSIPLMNKAVEDFELRNPDVRTLAICGQKLLKAAAKDDLAIGRLEHAKSTTDPEAVKAFLADGPGTVFCTYQSIDVVRDLHFQLGIFDEAHKSVGPKGKMFAKGLYDSHVKIDRRVFLTATPRVNKSGTGMDNEELYGKVADQLTYADAIAAGIVLPFRIGFFSSPDEVNDEKSADKLARHARASRYIVDATAAGSIKKGIVFTRLSNDARAIAKGMPPNLKALYFGGDAASTNEQRLKDFASGSRGVACCAKYLAEGVDVPSCDYVVFVDPRSSAIEITQILGRGIRVDENDPSKRFCTLVVPIFVPPDGDVFDAASKTRYRKLGEFLRALQEVDHQFGIACDNKIAESVTGTRPDGPQIEDYVTQPTDISDKNWKPVLVEIAVGASGDRTIGEFLDTHKEFVMWVIEHDGKWPLQRGQAKTEQRLGKWIAKFRSAILHPETSGILLTSDRLAYLRLIPGWKEPAHDQDDQECLKRIGKIKDYWLKHNRRPGQHSTDPETVTLANALGRLGSSFKNDSLSEVVTKEVECQLMPLGYVWPKDANKRDFSVAELNNAGLMDSTKTCAEVAASLGISSTSVNKRRQAAGFINDPLLGKSRRLAGLWSENGRRNTRAGKIRRVDAAFEGYEERARRVAEQWRATGRPPNRRSFDEVEASDGVWFLRERRALKEDAMMSVARQELFVSLGLDRPLPVYEANKVAVVSIDVDDRIVWYSSASNAHDVTNINASNITSCCQGRPGHKTAAGLRWRYATPEDEPKKTEG